MNRWVAQYLTIALDWFLQTKLLTPELLMYILVWLADPEIINISTEQVQNY